MKQKGINSQSRILVGGEARQHHHHRHHRHQDDGRRMMSPSCYCRWWWWCSSSMQQQQQRSPYRSLPLLLLLLLLMLMWSCWVLTTVAAKRPSYHHHHHDHRRLIRPRKEGETASKVWYKSDGDDKPYYTNYDDDDDYDYYSYHHDDDYDSDDVLFLREEERILAALEDDAATLTTAMSSTTAQDDKGESPITSTDVGVSFLSEKEEEEDAVVVVRRPSFGRPKREEHSRQPSLHGNKESVGKPGSGQRDGRAAAMPKGKSSRVTHATPINRTTGLPLSSSSSQQTTTTTTTGPTKPKSQALKRQPATTTSFQYVHLPESYRVQERSAATSVNVKDGNNHNDNIIAPTTTTTTATTTATRTTAPAHLLQPRRTTLAVPRAPPPTSRSSTSTTTRTTTTTTRWVRNFLASCHRDVLLPVPVDYCLDNFNLAQLAPVVERVGMMAAAAQQQQQRATAAAAAATNADDNNHHGEDLFSPQQHYPSLSKTGKQPLYPIYRQALRLLTHNDDSDNDENTDIHPNIPYYLQQATTALYLLIHQRYVISPRGLDMVRRRLLFAPKKQSKEDKSVDPIFGICPRQSCHGMPLLPVGDSDNVSLQLLQLQHRNDHDRNDMVEMAQYRAKRYCASCGEVFYHWNSKIDGCAWGTSFCHLFLLVCGPEIIVDRWKRMTKKANNITSSTVGDNNEYEPRIFGFRLHPSSRQVMGLSY